MKKTGLFLIIILLANTFALLSNKPDKAAVEFDYNYIKVNQYMGIFVNADAFTFIKVAIQPSYLFTPDRPHIRLANINCLSGLFNTNHRGFGNCHHSRNIEYF